MFTLVRGREKKIFGTLLQQVAIGADKYYTVLKFN
jgi:hypothetical protein